MYIVELNEKKKHITSFKVNIFLSKCYQNFGKTCSFVSIRFVRILIVQFDEDTTLMFDVTLTISLNGRLKRIVIGFTHSHVYTYQVLFKKFEKITYFSSPNGNK